YQVLQSNYKGIASFGGAFSNHIAALAAAGKRYNVPTLGFIRTHAIDEKNPTLQLAKSFGMTLIALSRDEYRHRSEPNFLAQLQKQYPEYMFVPEGGSNDLALNGLKELGDEISQQSNDPIIACAIGSGGTISGLLDALPKRNFIGIAAVNDKPLLQNLKAKYGERLTIDIDSLFGGYGKTTAELNNFCLEFFNQTHVPIEPIYTGKLFYALCHNYQTLIAQQQVLAIHTGGLQGLKGLDYRHQSPPHHWQAIYDQLGA
ncbi:MAG: pyridoxal-phosphate dependent enzyme, partial [Gammaproteobacteria bacterium]|nr:pyridoxal-phosphate dependent enzyme [Gammaproteobacteria bacterium]